MENGHATHVTSLPPKLSLAALGFITLFLELALIRFLGGSIWNLGYFPNLVLISVFIGMGAGFMAQRSLPPQLSTALMAAWPWLVLALAGCAVVLRPGVPGFGLDQGVVGGELYFSMSPDQGDAGYGLFVLWMALCVAVFAALSQWTARVFATLPPLTAYTADIGGSCTGIVVFAACSAFQAPAWAWFAILAVALPLTLPAARRGLLAASGIAALLGCVTLAQWQDLRLMRNPDFPGDLEVTWSPYQKLEVISGANLPTPVILANGIGHQFIMPEDALAKSHYAVPHAQRQQRFPGRPYGRVLIIGAGSGNDVASALRHGATHIDAVDIDPVIAGIGRRRNVLQPYADPRVTVTIDDGRAVLTRAQPGYDLIIFALTDSLVKLSSVSTLRLENFLFTADSVRRAYELLAPDGDLYLYNTYREDWLVDKIGRMLAEATGQAPAVHKAEGGVVQLRVTRADPAPAQPRLSPDVPTDDWPFLYLRERGVPGLYAGAMALLVAVLALLLGGFVLARRHDEAGAPLGLRVAFMLMGAAFMLLETKSVIQFSLLFGTTWLNNALVFLGVLLSVLLANRLAARLDASVQTAVSALLLASCLLNWVLPPALLLDIPSAPLRFVAAVLVMFSPVFFANMLFSLRFRDAPEAEHLFGWNLAGTTVGAVAEYTSMQVGYTALAAVVTALYVVALVLMRQPAQSTTSPTTS